MKRKENPLLSSISQELRGLRLQETKEILGHRYTLNLLSPQELSWAYEKAGSTVTARGDAASMVEYAVKMQRPILAAALAAIDGLAVEELFQLPEDISKETRELMLANPKAMAEWRRQEILDFLGEEMDGAVLNDLQGAYFDLEAKKRTKLEDIQNLSKGTPSKA